ncbi:MAG: Mur ligase family protein [Lentisphaeria bacterium]|nr:Mur ligase family protein [Lentisphaeria bacterium]
MPLPIKQYEDEFYRILEPFLNLENNTARKYTAGEYNLKMMPTLAALFDFPETTVKIIHVAGTKGKGSVCVYTTALLRQAGKRVGTFTSPHLRTFRERFLIDGQCPDYETILAHTRHVVETIQSAGLTPTFFEVLTILALSFFVDQGCDYAVMETGIGGRLDCTNYVTSPVCAAITAISFDHTELLGDTIAAIAGEKAGIIKPGVPVVCGKQSFQEARDVILQRAESLAAPVVAPVSPPPLAALTGLPPFQQENLAVANGIRASLGIAVDWRAFTPPAPPGRFQVIRETPPVILDAAHNADSAKRLVEAVTAKYPGRRFVCVAGMVAGKDYRGLLRELRKLDADFIFTNPRVAFKGSELHHLEDLAADMNLRWRSIPEIHSVTELPVDTPLLFTGSFFTATIGADLFDPEHVTA